MPMTSCHDCAFGPVCIYTGLLSHICGNHQKFNPLKSKIQHGIFVFVLSAFVRFLGTFCTIISFRPSSVKTMTSDCIEKGKVALVLNYLSIWGK
jgi:hypothetical protein